MGNNADILRIHQLSVVFSGENEFHALKNISFTLQTGKTTALIGPSGSGKSLTSLAIMGLLPKMTTVSGEIILIGFGNLIGKDENFLSKIRGKEIGMIFQEPMSALNPIRSVGQQLVESILAHQKLTKSKAKKLAFEWMEKVKLPVVHQLFHRFPHELSGGQKQRIMIAMAMCNYPKLLIADEPTTALDVTVQAEIVKLMKTLQREFNTALLFITHDLSLAKTIADEYISIEDGVIVNKSPLIFQAPEKENRIFDKLKSPLLAARDLSVYYKGQKRLFGKSAEPFKAVDKVSFSILKGETLGLVGESGCGKSSLSKAIMGLTPITSGDLYFEDLKLSTFKPDEWRKIRKHIQIIFQDPYSSLNPRMKIGDILAEPLLVHKVVSKNQVNFELKKLLGQVELPESSIDKYPHEFSGGQRQRICIARALAVRPFLIICDESVSALDIRVQDKILRLLIRLQRENKLTYLFISHDLKVVQSVSDRILVMEKGRIVESGDANQIMEHPQEDYTKKLIASIPGF